MKIDSDSFRLKSFYDIDWRAIENLSEMNKFIHYSLNSFFIISSENTLCIQNQLR